MKLDGQRLQLAVLCLTLALAFVSQLIPIYTVDVFYHLAVGEWILEHRDLPEVGLFSATRGDHAWVDNEWGFQVLVTLVDMTFGVRGLVILCALLMTAALALLSACLYRRGLPALAVALLVGVSALAMTPLTVRPQNLTYVMAAAFLWGVSELVERKSRVPLTLLPILMVVWVNCHGGFVIGLVILAIPIAAELGSRLLRAPSEAPLWELSRTFLITFAASFLNPYGWRQVVYPIEYALRPGLTAFNQEWELTALAQYGGLQFLMGLAILSFALAPKRPRLRDLLLFLAFAWFALRGRRHVGLAILALPVAFAPSLAALLEGWRSRVSFCRSPLFTLGAALLLVVCFFVCGRVPRVYALQFDPRVVLPVKAAEFLEKHPTPGKLFNQYRWGSYLMYRFKPAQRVFVDGRNDLYGADFMEEYLHVLDGRQGFAEILRSYQVGAVLLEGNERNWRLLHLLLEAGWICVHHSRESGVSVLILVQNSAEAQPLIERFRIPLTLPPPP